MVFRSPGKTRESGWQQDEPVSLFLLPPSLSLGSPLLKPSGQSAGFNGLYIA